MSNNRVNIETELLEKGQLMYTNIGDSMKPLIHEGKDIILIIRPESWNQTGARKLKRLDVALYKNSSGKYILHRVLMVRKNDYLICGDNRFRIESGITDSQVLGILDCVFRDGKEISVNSFKYRLYAHIWCDLFPLRAVIIMGRNFIRQRIIDISSFRRR